MTSITEDLSSSGPKIVLPGDILPGPESGLLDDAPTAPVIKLGPGLQPMDDDTIAAVKAGVLKHAAVGNRWWVESNQRRVSSSITTHPTRRKSMEELRQEKDKKVTGTHARALKVEAMF